MFENILHPSSVTAKPRLPMSLRMRMAQIRPQDVPRRPDIPMTDESIRLALQARDAERRQFERATGCTLDADGHVIGARS